MNAIQQKLKETREILSKATPGPYHVECVHLDHDDIAYEVSVPPEGFHVAFYQSNCMDHGLTAKSQAEFYAHACNELPKYALALEKAVAELELLADRMPGCPCMDGPGIAKSALTEIETILAGEK